ncbi:MAG: gfo/Idh/MocA family oxidoreductase, partial [Planctomycetota bacterium]
MSTRNTLRAGMVGMGMIFDETYRLFFENARASGLYDRMFGDLDVELTAVATRTGRRAEATKKSAGDRLADFQSFSGDDAVDKMLDAGVDFACVATPDDRHFEACKKILDAGVSLLV